MSNKKKKNTKKRPGNPGTPRGKYNIDPKDNPKVIRYVEERIKQAKEGRSNKKEAALNAGYSKACANSVKKSIESTRSYEQIMHEKLSDETLIDYLAEDLKKKPQERLGELKLAFDIKGLRDRDINIKTDNETINLLKSIIDSD